jgi:hypothetical protein
VRSHPVDPFVGDGAEQVSGLVSPTRAFAAPLLSPRIAELIKMMGSSALPSLKHSYE